MGSVTKLAGGAIFVGFLTAIAVRPLLSNPAVTAALGDGPSDWRILLWIPLGLLTVLLVTMRIKSAITPAGGDPPDRHSPRDLDAAATQRRADASLASGEPSSDRSPEEEATENRTSQDPPDILAGQGGTRNRDFEIEEVPPEVELGEHLKYLREQLDGDEHRSEIATLEKVVEDSADGTVIPDRCPREYCDARWSDRGLLGFNSGRYERLDGESRVRCLECEETFLLE